MKAKEPLTASRPVEPRPVKQNLSGHVTFDAFESKMHQEFNEKAMKVEALRSQGLLQYKPTRNPIRAEKTPRIDYTGFNFKPPTARPEPEKWNYPESDWGLMSKFNSQKHFYTEIERKEKEFADQAILNKLKREENQKELEAATIQQQIKLKQMNNNNNSEVLNETSRSTRTGEDTSRSVYSTQRSGFETNRSDHKLYKTDFHDYKISSIKEVGETHPEIIAKWRAQRAADFIATLKDPVAPPSSKPFDSSQPFVVPLAKAKTVNNNTQKELKSSKNQSKSKKISTQNDEKSHSINPIESQMQLSVLMNELKKTEEDLERQKLKIKLHNRTKSYQLEKSQTIINSARSSLL
eukprot:gene7979-10820_t